ncbi:MAG: Fic family protein [Candidatus Krumholzibacteriota bacterium]|nr:Fic family protein [Candidatus Krumholzibacteriota bacterium]
MRTYKRTHPWIDFTYDTRKASYVHWLLLGEAQSKCNHFVRVPMLPEVAKHFYGIYLAKGVIATTAIEGNTLTEEDALRHLEGTLELPPSKEYLRQEIDNIIEACKMTGQRILEATSIGLSVDDIKQYNRLVLRKLPLGEGIVPGEIRTRSVVVGGYRGAPAEDCEYLLSRLCDWINGELEAPPAYRMAFGILKAILAHLYIAWIHPFGDGNGRTARLVEFHLLLSVGVPATAAHLLSNHYNQTRSEYYRRLDLAHKAGENVFSFVEYALNGFVDGLKEQIEIIKNQQIAVHWKNYVRDRFQDKTGKPDLRRKWLVLDLSGEREPVPVAKIRYVTPRIAEAYAGKTDKTVQRDITALIDMGLVVKSDRGVRARMEIMSAFIAPFRT